MQASKVSRRLVSTILTSLVALSCEFELATAHAAERSTTNATLSNSLSVNRFPARAQSVAIELADAKTIFMPCKVGTKQYDDQPESFQAFCRIDTGARRSTLGLLDHPEDLRDAGDDTMMGASGILQTEKTVWLTKASIGASDAILQTEHLRTLLAHVDQSLTEWTHLGSDFFLASTSQYRALLFSFDKMQLTVGEPNSLLSSETRFPLTLLLGNTPAVHAQVGREQLLALWDTGWERTAIDILTVKAHPDLFIPVGLAQKSVDPSGHEVDSIDYIAKELRVGSLVVRNMPIVAIDFSAIEKRTGQPVKMAVGIDLMAKGNWMIDYHNLKWATQPAHDSMLNMKRLKASRGHFPAVPFRKVKSEGLPHLSSGQWPNKVARLSVLNSSGNYTTEYYSFDQESRQWSDLNKKIAKRLGVKSATLSPEYSSYRAGATQLLSATIYASDAKQMPPVLYFDVTPPPWIILIQGRDQAETNCLSWSEDAAGRLQGCGDVWQGGLTQDKVACFEKQNYIRCHLECMEQVHHIRLNYAPGFCGERQ